MKRYIVEIDKDEDEFEVLLNDWAKHGKARILAIDPPLITWGSQENNNDEDTDTDPDYDFDDDD